MRASDGTASSTSRSREKRTRGAGRTPNRRSKGEEEKKKKKKKGGEERKSRSREKEGRRRKRDESLNNLEDEEKETFCVKGKRNVFVSAKEETKQTEALMTLDTGSRFSIVDENEAKRRNFKIEKLTKYEKPNLRNPDGSKFEIIGKSETWVRLSQKTHKMKIQFFVTKKLQSVFILGLQDLRKLNFIPHTWPANLEKHSYIRQKRLTFQ